MSRYILIIFLICFAYSATFQDGYNNFVRGEYKQAIDVFSVLLAQKPNDYKTTLWLGKSYFYLGDQKKAIETLIKATKLKPNDTEAKELLDQVEYIKENKKVAEANYHKGYFSFMKSDYATAKEYYWQAILLDSEVSKYHLWHLRSLIGLGELNKARAELEYAENLKPYDNAYSILKSEDLRTVTADKDYYDLLVSLKEKKISKEIKIINKVDQPSSVQQPKTIIKNTDTPAVKPTQVTSNKKIIDVILSKNEEYLTQIPTLNSEQLRKESTAFQGSTTKTKHSF